MTDCGNYETTLTSAEAQRDWFKCSCGKVVKIKARRDDTVFIPRHNSPKTIVKTK